MPACVHVDDACCGVECMPPPRFAFPPHPFLTDIAHLVLLSTSATPSCMLLCAASHCVVMLQASLFDHLLISCPRVLACAVHGYHLASSLVPQQQQQQQQEEEEVSHACTCKAAKPALLAVACKAAAKAHAPAVLLFKSTTCSTTWRMVATLMLSVTD